MTQTIAPPHAAPALSGTWLRVTLIVIAAVLMIAAFATGRSTAPDSTGTLVDAPSAIDTVAQPFDCPPSRPPVC